jgi:hypothetical protein
MKEWYMVHNFVDGLPIQAVEKLDQIRKADQKRGLVSSPSKASRSESSRLTRGRSRSS